MKCGQVQSGIHLAGMAKTVLFGSEESTVSSASSLQQLRVSHHPQGLPVPPVREGQRTWGEESARRTLE